jgi:hypothetical protein
MSSKVLAAKRKLDKANHPKHKLRLRTLELIAHKASAEHDAERAALRTVRRTSEDNLRKALHKKSLGGQKLFYTFGHNNRHPELTNYAAVVCIVKVAAEIELDRVDGCIVFKHDTIRIMDYETFDVLEVNSHVTLTKIQQRRVTNDDTILGNEFDEYAKKVIIENLCESEWEEDLETAHCSHEFEFRVFVPYNDRHTFEDYVTTVKTTYGIDYRPVWVQVPSYNHRYTPPS